MSWLVNRDGYLFIPTYLSSISSPIYPKQPGCCVFIAQMKKPPPLLATSPIQIGGSTKKTVLASAREQYSTCFSVALWAHLPSAKGIRNLEILPHVLVQTMSRGIKKNCSPSIFTSLDLPVVGDFSFTKLPF